MMQALGMPKHRNSGYIVSGSHFTGRKKSGTKRKRRPRVVRVHQNKYAVT